MDRLSKTYVFGEVLEVVEHVEAVEVDGARRHCVVGEPQRLSQLEDEPVVVDGGVTLSSQNYIVGSQRNTFVKSSKGTFMLGLGQGYKFCNAPLM